MKITKIVATILLSTLLLTSVAIAQSVDKRSEADLLPPVIAARCQYTPADAACVSTNVSGQGTTSTTDDSTIAQRPRRTPGPPGGSRRSPMGYPRGGCCSMWMPAPNGRHAMIGAAIGFGLGAAVGAKGTGGARVTLTLGAIGGLIGAAFGLMTPSFRMRSPYPRGPWPDDDDEVQVSSKPAPSNPASAKATPDSEDGSPALGNAINGGPGRPPRSARRSSLNCAICSEARNPRLP